MKRHSGDMVSRHLLVLRMREKGQIFLQSRGDLQHSGIMMISLELEPWQAEKSETFLLTRIHIGI